MPIQLIISGDHITDVFAEVSTFAEAINAKQQNRLLRVSEDAPAIHIVTESDEFTSQKQPAKPAVKADAKLTREQQDNAVDEMIAAGKKDERYALLTKGRQKNVDDGITSKPETIEDSLNDMFDEVGTVEEVTLEDVRSLMAEVGKDTNGEQIQEKLIQIRDIIVRFVPEGAAPKIGEIPKDKLAEVAAELEKLKA